MAPSYATISPVSAGIVAEQSPPRQVAKYNELAMGHIFKLIAMESFGPKCSEALTFLKDRRRCMSEVTVDLLETAFLFTHLSIAIQRFNCVLFKSTVVVR